jgi:hypothetical protein
MTSGGRVVSFTPTGKPVTHGGSGNAYSAYGCRCDECRAANAARAKRRRLERYAEGGDFEHGVCGYTNWGCRCDECSEAHSEMLVAAYESRKARAAADAPHGTVSGYSSWGCRCDECLAVGRAHYRDRQRERRSAS